MFQHRRAFLVGILSATPARHSYRCATAAALPCGRAAGPSGTSAAPSSGQCPSVRCIPSASETRVTAAQDFMSRSPDANVGKLTACCARAILFSDRDTCAKLSAFSSQLITFRADPASFSPDAFNDAAYDAFESMRQELLQMHHPLVKHKHRR